MQRLKRIVKLVIPPIIVDCYHKILSKKKISGKVFIGEYDNFDELCDQLAIEPGYYWPGAIEQQFNNQKQRIGLWNSSYPPSGMYRSNFLPTALTLFSGNEIHLLDIGGGVDGIFEYLKFSLPKKSIHVTVVDQKPSIQSGKKLYIHNQNIEFVENFSETKGSFDVVYFGSSIQYFADYQEIFNKVTLLNPKLIVITDSSFNTTKTFACAQINMGNTIPYMVISKNELEEVAHNLGYELIHQSINAETGAIFDPNEYPLHKCRSWNFIFQKRCESAT